ncbi:GNAT family N-acetyltransferase [Herbiconiux sp. CPCC 205716]|uniref:GNAT family N-acetyltransferase n=1 Tax=Herbiconiux gentiana TaxID=2970912 RepID=A0ABT2GKZ5_9MICO|nr:GNAT family N-acetyltransferase [Herbiconiux gentiana]MCS5715594.1 GNAT family N-acetyltransferase [Herbiconiux gentiana]
MSAGALELRTDRLLLRRWRASDHEPFAALNADPAVMEFFPAPLTRAESDAMAERADAGFDERGYGLWAVELTATGEFAGFVGLAPMPDGFGGVEVGWRLARAFWGAGYATEAARASIRFAFETLGLPEVSSVTSVINVRSQAVMRRLGMTPAEHFDSPRVPPGSPLVPHVRYALQAPPA